MMDRLNTDSEFHEALTLRVDCGTLNFCVYVHMCVL